MLYRDFGRTGKKISAIGFGAMRFIEPVDEEASAAVVLRAFERGVNYFDTAPAYCMDKSEIVIGKAAAEMRRRGGTFYLSTKGYESDGAKVRARLENSLKRLGAEAIDFYHCWCVTSLEDWAERKSGGAVAAILKAREEGLVRHACISTHLDGEGIARILSEGIFEVVTLGYSAINFPYRAAGIEAARRAGLGVVVMNPLGGGLLTDHPDRFAFIRRPGDRSLVVSALRFVLSTPGVTCALAGCSTVEQVDEAVSAAEDFRPLPEAEMDDVRRGVRREFDTLCTLCSYCRECPQDIPVPQLMSAYNYRVIENPKAMQDQLRMHWEIRDVLGILEHCNQCGACQEACTQKLPVLERLEDIRKIYEAESPRRK